MGHRQKKKSDSRRRTFNVEHSSPSKSPPTEPSSSMSSKRETQTTASVKAPSSAVLAAAAKFKALKNISKDAAALKTSSTAQPADTAARPSPSSGPERDEGHPLVNGAPSVQAPPITGKAVRDPGLEAAPALVCFTFVVVFVFFALVAARVFLESRRTGEERQAFCCPGDVQSLAMYINSSIDPCDSFFDFICSIPIARYEEATNSDTLFLLRLNPTSGVDVLLSNNGTRNQVSAFLRSLLDSCMSAPSDENVILDQLGSSLIEIAGGYLQDLRRVNGVAYLLLTSLKYGIPSIVSLTLQAPSTLSIAFNLRDGCLIPNNTFERCLNFSMTRLDRHLKDRDIKDFAAGLQATKRSQLFEDHYRGNIATQLLQRWHLAAALKLLFIDLGNLTEVRVKGTNQIDALIVTLNTSDSKKSDEVAVYFFAASTCNALMDLRWLSVKPPPNRLTSCTAQIDRLPNVRNTLYTVEYVTWERNIQVTRVINSVIETIKKDSLRTKIFNEVDASLLRAFLDSMSLVLPSVMGQPTLRHAHFSLSFVEKLLEGRALEFETRLALMRQGIPFESATQPLGYVELQSGNTILVSPKLYPLIRTDSAHTDIFNTPIIASALAKSIWHFILTEEGLWSYPARAYMDDYVACFRTHYFTQGSKERSVEDQVETVAASLALSSVLRSFAESRWFKPEKAWRHWSLSRSQFFFMRETFYGCPTYYTVTSKEKVDVPLMYSGDFAVAFQCRANDRMAKRRTCSLTTMSMDSLDALTG